jgi:hypothetical protein
MKDVLELKTAGVYSIPCTCGSVHIGQSGQSIAIRMKEHHWHICPEQWVTVLWQSTLSKANITSNTIHQYMWVRKATE